MEEQLDLASKKIKSFNAASAPTAIRAKRKLACLQKDLYFNQQRMAAVESSLTNLGKEFVFETTKVGNLESRIVTLWMELKTSPLTRADVETELATDLGRTHDELA